MICVAERHFSRPLFVNAMLISSGGRIGASSASTCVKAAVRVRPVIENLRAGIRRSRWHLLGDAAKRAQLRLESRLADLGVLRASGFRVLALTPEEQLSVYLTARRYGSLDAGAG